MDRSTGGKTVSQASQEAMDAAERALAEQAARTPDPSLPPEAQRAMREAQEQLREQQQQMREQREKVAGGMKALEVPPQNIALFRKYEADRSRSSWHSRRSRTGA